MNNRRKSNWANFLLVIFIVSLLQVYSAKATAPIVQALLFFSPTCPHCHKVIKDDLPPLLKKYGKQLKIILINVRQEDGQALYQAAIKHFQIPEERLGVPTLIVGNEILVGADEIPAQFPKLIENFLAQGGIGWPPIPGLKEAFADMDESQAPSLRDKLAHDPVGNGLAIFVLIGMLFMVLHSLVRLKENLNDPQALGQEWLVPLLSVLGIAISGYMMYIETAQVAAVCGPIGDCNAVQQSEYARLFGVLPIGVLGVIGYFAILLAWSIGHYGSEKFAHSGRIILFVLTLLGTLFSIYLTFLEPFVIGATCSWCLASAIIMTALLWQTRVVKRGIVQ